MANENNSRNSTDSSSQERQDVQWYLGVDNEALGPLSLKQTSDLFRSGKASASTQAWTHGMDGWVDAGTIDALKAFMGPPVLKLQSGPPPTPGSSDPTSDLDSKAPESLVKSTQTNPTTPTQAQLPVSVPVVAKKPDIELRPDMPFEELIAAMGLSMAQVQDMASNSVGISGHTKASLKLAPLLRWGMVRKSENA